MEREKIYYGNPTGHVVERAGNNNVQKYINTQGLQKRNLESMISKQMIRLIRNILSKRFEIHGKNNSKNFTFLLQTK